jgi:serpin B
MPTFGFRSTLDLREALRSLGMATAFSPAADFSGLTADDVLMLQAVAHQGFVALDKEGVEAAAATVVTAMPVSATMPQHELLLDRPFLFCIHDVELALPLLIGVVNDPSVS